jgi:dolichol-phosphate mannosyltransferase
MKKAVIVIPTYNEIESISKIVNYLFIKIFPKIKNWHCQLLIVDDTSPDGTYKAVKKLQKKYKDLFLLLNKDKAGIGNAYVKGFKLAMSKLKADVVIEFDSDFQHPPTDIPVMLKEIDKGADYVMGSRKIKGGSNPKGWGFKRLFFSEAGGFMARFILFFPFKNFFKITDPTTGLKASRVKGFVDTMDMDNLYSKKFGYKLEFLFKMVLSGAKIKEIPLKFGLRTVGESKISGQTATDILKTVILLRLKDDPFVKKFLKFGTVGFIGYLVNAYFLGLFSRFEWKEIFSWLGSTELAIISNFTLNNIWTFKSDKISGLTQLLRKFFQFNFTSVGALIIQSAAGVAGVRLLGLNRQLLLPFIIVFLVLPYNWLMYNKVIWKAKKA